MTSIMNLPNVRVGVAAVIGNENGKFLIGKRKGSHGAGTLQTPGGHLEHGEDLGACAVREAQEETGLVVEAGDILTITNDVFAGEDKHYITVFINCTMTDPNAKPETKEPHKCEGWEWKSWDELMRIDDASKSDPSSDKLFLPLVNLVKQTNDLNALVASKGL
ncbi:nudix domain-containing protein [Trichoderma evansii]